MARKLIVEIVGDSRSYERALKRSSTATNQFGQAMGATNPKLAKLNLLSTAAGGGMLYAGGAAAGLAVAIGAKSVSAASDLNEQLSRTEVVMGESAEGMIDWSKTTATSMGISQRAALAAAGTFAGLFQTVGVQQQQAADLSKSLVQLAADMASLANTSPEEALIALRSGLAGEAEPLRRYNIFLTEARVAQQALTETGKDNVRQLTQQEKTLARYTLIMKDSVLAQGNFALTQEGLANQTRVLRAQVDDLSTKLGAVLVPAVTAVVGALNDAIQVGEDFAGVVQALADLPVIEIPVNLVGGITAGRGGSILRHIVLGGVSPLALGITIGKEVADGIRQGANLAPTLGAPEGAQPGVGGAQRAAARGQRAAAELTKTQATQGQAIVDRIARQAANQKSLNRQIAESETRAAHLKDLIRADPGNVKLQQRLTAEYKKQNDLKAEQVALGKQNAATAKAEADEAKRAREEAAAAARATLIGTLDLAEAQAGLTKGLQDNLTAAKDRESTLKRLVAANRDDLDLAQQLVAATIARRDVEKEIAEKKRAAKVAAQFKELGLLPGGETPAPSAAALLRRTGTIEDQLKGTLFDTAATRKKLKMIANFLKKNMKGTAREIRLAILAMLNDVNVDENDIPANITRERVMKGEGASAFGMITRGRGPLTSAKVLPAALNPINVYVTLDGKEIGTVVTRQGQKQTRRSVHTRAGRHGGI